MFCLLSVGVFGGLVGSPFDMINVRWAEALDIVQCLRSCTAAFIVSSLTLHYTLLVLSLSLGCRMISNCPLIREESKQYQLALVYCSSVQRYLQTTH